MSCAIMDKRIAPRHQVRKAGTLEFGGRAFSCMVRDLSTVGAALDVPAASRIPDHFTLTIPTDGLYLRCCAVWREGMRIGVEFN